MDYVDEAQAISRVVSAHFGVARPAIWERGRHRPAVNARRAVWWLMRRRTQATLAEIGRVFGRDHSTVSYGLRAFERTVAKDDDVNDAISGVMREMGLGGEAPEVSIARVRREIEILKERITIAEGALARIETRQRRMYSGRRGFM